MLPIGVDDGLEPHDRCGHASWDPEVVRQAWAESTAIRATARQLAREADDLIRLAIDLRRVSLAQVDASRALIAASGRLLADAAADASRPPPAVVARLHPPRPSAAAA